MNFLARPSRRHLVQKTTVATHVTSCMHAVALIDWMTFGSAFHPQSSLRALGYMASFLTSPLQKKARVRSGVATLGKRASFLSRTVSKSAQVRHSPRKRPPRALRCAHPASAYFTTGLPVVELTHQPVLLPPGFWRCDHIACTGPIGAYQAPFKRRRCCGKPVGGSCPRHLGKACDCTLALCGQLVRAVSAATLAVILSCREGPVRACRRLAKA